MAKLFYALVLKILWFLVLLNAYYIGKSCRENRCKLTSASEASFWIHHGETVGKANKKMNWEQPAETALR